MLSYQEQKGKECIISLYVQIKLLVVESLIVIDRTFLMQTINSESVRLIRGSRVFMSLVLLTVPHMN